MKQKTLVFGIIGIALLLGALLFYLFVGGNSHRQILANVNGEEITVEQFNQELSKIENPLRDIYKEDPRQFLDGMIIKMLVIQEAKREGFAAPAKTYKDIAKDEEALVEELMKKKFSSPPAVKREEIEAFYTMFKDQMRGGSLDQMAPAIEQMIREEKQREEITRFIENIRKNAKIEISDDRLKRIASQPPESNTAEEFNKALTSGKPVLVDFGANSCIPCRQMRPILKEVGKEFAGKANVLVIDVYKYQPLAKDYRVQLIPTLIFFDSKGKEVFRNTGAMEKEKIVKKLKEVGVGS